MLGAGKHRQEASHDSSLFNSSSDDDNAGDMLTGEPQLDIEEFFAKIDITGGLMPDLKIAKPIKSALKKNKESLIDLETGALVDTDKNEAISDERKWLKRFSEPDSPDNIVFDSEDPSLILAIRKEKLVALLTSDADKCFTEDFLTTFHLFMKPEELASMVGVRLRSAYMSDTQGNQKIRLVTFRLIKLWCSEYLVDEKHSVSTEIKKILNEAVNRVWEDALMLTMSDKQLLMSLGNVLDDKEPFNKSSEHKISTADVVSSLPEDYEVFLMEKSVEIAEQLSLLEEQIFSKIDWKDLLSLAQPIKASSTDQSSLEQAVFHFNGMCKWFVSEVCRSSSVNAQSEKIKKLVKAGHRCMKIGNLSTAFQVSLALQNHSIKGLKEAWERLPKRIDVMFQELTALTSPLKNFSAVRRTIELIDGSPCVPFLGIYISDMKALSEAPNDYPAELVPWHRFQLAAKILRRFRVLQDKSAGYQFRKNSDLFTFISDPNRYSSLT